MASPDLRILLGCSNALSRCAGATPLRNIGKGFTGGPDGAGRRFTPVCSLCLDRSGEKGPGSTGNCFFIEGRGGPCNLTSPWTMSLPRFAMVSLRPSTITVWPLLRSEGWARYCCMVLGRCALVCPREPLFMYTAGLPRRRAARSLLRRAKLYGERAALSCGFCERASVRGVVDAYHAARVRHGRLPIVAAFGGKLRRAVPAPRRRSNTEASCGRSAPGDL